MNDLFLLGKKTAHQKERLARLKNFRKVLVGAVESDEKAEAEMKIK